MKAGRRRPREVEAVTDSIDQDGYGVAMLGERQLRIKNALPGERVKAKVLKRRKGQWLGEAFEVDSPARQRAAPACEYFPRCGGCVMQHLDYGAQIELKQQHLLDALHRRGVVAAELSKPLLGPRLHYRSKARFGVRVVGGQVLVGFRESFSNRVGRMDGCLTLVPRLGELIGPLKSLLSQLSCPDRIPQIEVAAGDEDAALILRHLDPLTESDRELIGGFAVRHAVRCFGQSGGYETVRPLSENAENRYLSYANADFGVHYLFAAADFTQVNLSMNRMLVRAALEGLAAPQGATVIDLFCGIGNFSLALAASGNPVVGVEASASAIERARLNAAHNRLTTSSEFRVQDLYHPDCLEVGNADYLLLDPPRSGAGPNLGSWIKRGGIRRVSYVSCSPESFAADAGLLAGLGFELRQVGIIDMFPHTAHVETLGVFEQPW